MTYSGRHRAELKETMWCGVFNILWTKPLFELLTYWTAVRSPVSAALNYQVKDITQLRRTFAFILYLTTRGPSHLSFGLSCVSFRSGGNHRSSRGFYVQLFHLFILFLLLTFWGRTAKPVGPTPGHVAAENKLLYTDITWYISLIHLSVFFKILKKGFVRINRKSGHSCEIQWHEICKASPPQRITQNTGSFDVKTFGSACLRSTCLWMF